MNAPTMFRAHRGAMSGALFAAVSAAALLPLTSGDAVADCVTLFAGALDARDVPAVAALLDGEAATDACEWNQLEYARTEATKWLAESADRQRIAGDLAAAEASLAGKGDGALRLASWWRVNAVLGDIAMERRAWDEATRQYGEAYQLAVEQLTPASGAVPPEIEAVQLRLFALANESLVLGGDLSAALPRGEGDEGLLGSRGPKPRQVPIPVQFEFGKATFTPAGREAVVKLGEFASRRGLDALEVVGHADPVGDRDRNQTLSERRADAVAEAIRASYRAAGETPPRIATRGEGVDCPALLSDPARYSETERHALYRRVELVLDPSRVQQGARCGEPVQ